MQLANPWYHYFTSHKSLEGANTFLPAYAHDMDVASSARARADELLRFFTKDPDTAMMAWAPFLTEAILYHSVTNLGGSRTPPDDKMVGLLGMNDEPVPMVFDSASVLSVVSISCPSTSLLKGLTLASGLAALSAPSSHTMPLKMCAFNFCPLLSPQFSLLIQVAIQANCC